MRTLTTAIAEAREGGTEALLAWFEAYIGRKLPRKARGWLLENDAAALDAAWTSALAEGDISSDFSGWRIPCLIAAGDGDEFHDSARRAAEEIPTATFVSLTGRDHISSIDEVNRLMPGILELLKT